MNYQERIYMLLIEDHIYEGKRLKALGRKVLPVAACIGAACAPTSTPTSPTGNPVFPGSHIVELPSGSERALSPRAQHQRDLADRLKAKVQKARDAGASDEDLRKGVRIPGIKGNKK